MIKFALKGGDPSAAAADAAAQDEHIAPVPRISIQAFCDLGRYRRRHAGGERRPPHDQGASEGADGRHRRGDRGLSELRRRRTSSSSSRTAAAKNCSTGSITLAEVCDAGTRVIAVGHLNDILLYREMVRRGVSDYLIAPVGPVDLVRAISGLFYAADAKPVGRTHRGGRRQGRRRRLHRRAQHRLGDRTRCASRRGRRRSRPRRSAPPGSISTRTRRRASRTP